MELHLTRPFAIFDLETTGTNVSTDRIVEISILKLMVDRSEKIKTHRVNPTIPIPPSSTQIHGITDDDVRDKPVFAELAGELASFLANCDLGGYNLIKFDIPLLVEEFLRAGVDFEIRNRRIVDVQNIFHKMEPRTLRAAYKFYCGKEHVHAHNAEADTQAAYEILKAQLDIYKDVEYIDFKGLVSYPVINDIEALHEFSFYNKNADLVGHIIFDDQGIEVFNFGKYKSRAVEDVFKREPQYYDWMMKSEFPLYTKKVITSIMLRGFNKGNAIKD
jgi:DNA polymerase-3 subunit epsilon